MTAEGYTAVACQSDSCCTSLALMPALRAAIRSAPHGVLVSSGCSLGTLTCRTRPGGPVVLVQPCDVRRRPVGPAAAVGPLRTPADVADLVAWLRGGLDVAALPGRLRFDPVRRLASHN